MSTLCLKGQNAEHRRRLNFDEGGVSRSSASRPWHLKTHVGGHVDANMSTLQENETHAGKLQARDQRLGSKSGEIGSFVGLARGRNQHVRWFDKETQHVNEIVLCVSKAKMFVDMSYYLAPRTVYRRGSRVVGSRSREHSAA